MDITVEKLSPVGKRVLVQVYEGANQTASGLVFAEKDNTPTPVVGTIIKAGDLSSFKEGDVVFFRRYSVDELKFKSMDGVELTFHMLEDEEVVAKVNQ